MPLKTEILPTDAAGLARAADLLRGGGLVAFPTETVYGLGANARNDLAVARIFEAKARPRFNPLIVHVADITVAKRYAIFNDTAERLAQAFWPGPLTLVLPLAPGAGLSPLVTADLPTVAIRIPAHPLAHALLTAFNGPVAAPSANPSGRISPTRVAHVLDGLEGRIDAVLDGGSCDVGVESTILEPLEHTARLLRPGGLPVEALEACLGTFLQEFDISETITAPGQLASHYAPNAGVRLGVTAPNTGELWLGFGPSAHAADLNLSPSGDLIEAAANLFHMLRNLDARAAPGSTIAVSKIPDTGLGRAINDRLRRAAAPRG